MLVKHLLSETAGELIAASAGMTKSELSHLLAERYPKADLPTIIRPLGPLASAPAPVGGEEPMSIDVGAVPAGIGAIAAPGLEPALSVPERIDGGVCAPAGPTSAPPPARSRVAPLAPERYAIQVTVSKATHDKLRRAQALLSHGAQAGGRPGIARVGTHRGSAAAGALNVHSSSGGGILSRAEGRQR